MPGNSDSIETGSTPKKELSAAEIARDWQVRQGTKGPSRQYVSGEIKKGCPQTSFDAAWQWRVEHAKYGIGHRSKREPGTPAPVTSVPVPQEPREASMTPPLPDEPEEHEPVASLLPLENSLAAAIDMEERAYRLAVALGTEASLRAYNTASGGRFDAERSYREEMERRKVIGPMSEAMEIGRKPFDVLLPGLYSLGGRIAGEISPENAVHAATVIDREVKALVAQARLTIYEVPAA